MPFKTPDILCPGCIISKAKKEKFKDPKNKKAYLQRTGYDNPMHNPNVVKVNHTKGYTFENISFDSSWELAYYIWLRDNNKSFIYHPPYYMDYVDDEGVNRVYQPDFLVEGQFYEIKGDQFFNEKGEPYNRYIQKYWWGKYNAIKSYNIQILTLEDVKKYLKYVKDNYGKNYLKQFKNTRIQSSTTIEKELRAH